MEPESNRSSADNSFIDERISFPHVTAVASGWISDFMFVSLCRLFKEGKLDEFNEILSTSQAISENPSLKGGLHDEKLMISAFLARVMHGKQLDVLFEEDDHVMPLMSAANIWSELEETVADENLFRNIAILLLVQSVAVCLEKGQRSSASSALKWFEDNHEIPRNLGAKLSTIVTQTETYHPFLTSFSFSHLLEAIQSYLDVYLEKNPSDYLLKAAIKMVQSSQSTGALEDAVTRDISLSETANKSTEERKTKRKLMSTKIIDVWKPDSCKKPFVSVKRISSSELSRLTSVKSVDPSSSPKLKKIRKAPQKWTPKLDKYLKDGVKHHGLGKWSRILMDYDFEGRTGTMLKDRWRVLMRAHQVG